MTTPLLRTALEPIVSRHRRLRLLVWVAVAWFAVAALGALIHSAPLLALTAIGASWAVARCTLRWQPDYAALARDIEQRRPELQHLLRTAVEQQPDAATGRLNYLQLRVVAEAVGACQRSEVIESVPKARLAAAWAVAVLALGFLAHTLSTLPVSPERRMAKHPAAQVSEEVTVTPGDAAIERGSGLVVMATFHKDVPSGAALVIETVNEPPQRFALVKNLNDPVFGGGVPDVRSDLTYRVEYAGKATRDFRISVFEHPRLERADVALNYPDYTGLPDKLIPDTRRVSAVEGTKIEVTFQLNKPVRKAALVAKDGTVIVLDVDAAKPLAKLAGYEITGSGVYELKLEDADGRAAKVPAQFTVDALPNRLPEMKLLTPRGDVRVSPIEEVTFRVEAWDDFGMSAIGITYTVADGEPRDLRLSGQTKADERLQLAHTLRLEELGVQPDELLSWFVWAEDIGPDGQPRRTAGDMYFGEVRPFEEIYRQGQAQEGGQQQQQQSAAGNQAQEAAGTQKQIISATWNLLRAERDLEKPGEKYLKDEPVVRDSQAELLNKTRELAERIEDPKSRAFAEAAVAEMEKALELLKSAETTAKPLPDAVNAERSAYNALLKLAAHEYEVSRQNSRSRSRSQTAQSQQMQLDQLEMKEEEKRYETQTEAETPQNEEQREQLAALNRLKELAQRQGDINERLKELQAALQEAKTEQEKEELSRQLKRLREEQQELLADMDELRQNMEKPENQSRFAEDRKKLDETRSGAQKTAEAMQQGEASKALASGTRTQRELEQMRDEVRSRTSRQFSDEMRQMRANARDIAERQQELAEKLAETEGRPERRTLDGSGEREQTAKALAEQQEKFRALSESMKQVSEQAEVAEPLLSRELYDTLRKSAQAGTEQTLENTRLLSERGYSEQARKFEEKARAEIEEVKSGVERAAEHVLGNEAEALRRARGDLDELARELNNEIERNSGRQAPGEQQPGGQQGGREDSNSQAGRGEQAAEGNNGEQRANTGERAVEDGQRGQGEPGREQDGQQEARANGQPQQQGGSASSPQGNREPGQQEPGERGQGERQNGNQPSQSGNQPGQRGEQPGQRGEQQGGQPGGQQSGVQGESSGERQPGAEEPDSQQPGQGKQPGASGQGRGSGDSQGERRQQENRGAERAESRLANLANMPRERGGIRRDGGGYDSRGGGGEDNPAGPLTGERYVEWSDRLRNVEEMLDDPELRNEAARIREIAKGMRAEFKRHSVEPKWDIVESRISKPLAELRNRVAEELARRDKTDSLVPIDRDPVPSKFAERVRQYYEELGRAPR